MRAPGRGLAGVYPAAQPLAQPASVWDLIPGGHRLRGANISGRLNAQTVTYLPDLWHNWEWSAAGAPGAAGNWIKPQIDAGIALGCNVFRFFGTLQGRVGSGSTYANPLDDATYFARWDQFLSYLRAQGVYAYPCLDGDTTAGDYGAYTNFTPTMAWRQQEIAKCARFFQKYADIIVGVDLINECTTWANTANQGLTLYQTAKAEAPRLKFTFSVDFSAAPNPGGTNSQGKVFPVAACRDYTDCHVYYDPAVTDFDSTMSFYGMPLLLGEFGRQMSAGTAARQSRYNTTKAVVLNVTAGRQAAGALAWSMYDQDTVTTNQWGIADANGNIRTDVSSIFSSFPA